MRRDPVTELSAQHDFVTSVSHELRTPLTSILGYTDVLLDGSVGELTPLQHRMVERIDSNSQRLLTLVENLLTLSGIESGTFTLERQRLDLVGVVSDSLARALPALRDSGLDLSLDLGSVPLPVIGDETQLGRMLSRLIDNAVAFSPPGGQLRVTLQPEGDEVVLEIADTGVGIAEPDPDHLFTSFARAREARVGEIQGLGLGLAVVGSIVTAHGGRVSLSSTPGVGTVVSVRLPRADDDPTTPDFPLLPGSAAYDCRQPHAA